MALQSLLTKWFSHLAYVLSVPYFNIRLKHGGVCSPCAFLSKPYSPNLLTRPLLHQFSSEKVHLSYTLMPPGEAAARRYHTLERYEREQAELIRRGASDR